MTYFVKYVDCKLYQNGHKGSIGGCYVSCKLLADSSRSNLIRTEAIKTRWDSPTTSHRGQNSRAISRKATDLPTCSRLEC